MPNRTEDNFLNRYFEKKEQSLESSKYMSYFKIITFFLCLLIYIFILVVETRSVSDTVTGILAQFQVMISVYLVVSAVKNGYIIGVSINVIQFLLVAINVFSRGNVRSAPGMILPICTIITITIIYVFSRRLNQKYEEIKEQKEELVTLYEELAVTEGELFNQNKQLLEYNQDMKENEEKLNYLAFFDVLTELPNRKMIINRLDILITLSMEKKMKFAMIFIDLDNFKRINDSMGHHAGDLLLQEVALRLKAAIHSDDMLGRLGGDEFALIIQRQLEEDEILEYLEKLRKEILKKFFIESTELTISASFGISVYPRDGDNSTDLLKCSDTAMYKVKEDGKNGVQFFNKEMKDRIFMRMELEKRLLASIENEELYLVYQPQYKSDTKKLRGFETLIRWNSPELGFVSPVTFIPVAEETKFINTMGRWIIKTACTKFKELQDKYHFNAVLSVNISAVQIMEPSFVQMIKKVLEETGVRPYNLEIEITESIFISSMEYVIGVLTELKEIGINIALDDFGTGYSSLSYLQLLPIDTLKIDKVFIDSIVGKGIDKHIVGPIISLVHQMDISVVAEGVENSIQLDYLKDHSCDCIQGYIWGKPLNEEDLNKLLYQLTLGEAKGSMLGKSISEAI